MACGTKSSEEENIIIFQLPKMVSGSADDFSFISQGFIISDFQTLITLTITQIQQRYGI